MNKYILVNPVVEGLHKNIYENKNSLEAAKEAYDDLSKNFSSIIKNYKFTIAKINSIESSNKINLSNLNDKKFYHFIVNEKIDKNAKNNDDVKFSIKPYTDKIFFFDDFKEKSSKKIKKFNKNNKIINGGKKSKFDENDEYDDFIIKKKYVDYYTWWYNPLIYYPDIVYMPTFLTPFNYILDFSPLNLYSNYYTPNVDNVVNITTTAK